MLTPRTTRRGFVALGSAVVAGRTRPPRLAGATHRLPARGQSLPLTGRVIWPGDPAYDSARQPFNTRFARYPAGIVICSSIADVQNAVRWARLMKSSSSVSQSKAGSASTRWFTSRTERRAAARPTCSSM